MLTLTTSRGVVRPEVVEVPVWRLPLPGGEYLELVWIPGGTYRIGAERDELRREWSRVLYGNAPGCRGREHRVEEQRTVRLDGFAMARMPITRGQWRAVAALPSINAELKANPTAGEHDPSLPVVNVSWNDVREWCDRLNHHLRESLSATAPRLGLPSEAQWEVAARAGGRTAFHFGDTISAAWANFNGAYAFPPDEPPSGLNQGRSTPVGAYGLVNRWGLADIHGNVFEWCQDQWQPLGPGGTEDGAARQPPSRGWDRPDEEPRLLRGGSWFSIPSLCRSAFRLSLPPDESDSFFGFRVCCLPAGHA
jgi:formylglycine-generating enzyme required for sulfatase activity